MPISKVQSVYATTTKRTDLELGPSPSVTLNSVPLPWRDVWYLRRRVCVCRHAGGPFRSFCVFVASLAFPSQGLRPARVSWVLRQKPCCRFKTNKKRTYLMGLWWWWRGERTSREEGPAFIMSMCVCERQRIERVLLPNVLLHRRRSAIEWSEQESTTWLYYTYAKYIVPYDMFKITIRKLCLFSSCKQAGWGCFLQPCFFLDVCDIQRNISNLSIHIAFVCSFSGRWGGRCGVFLRHGYI